MYLRRIILISSTLIIAFTVSLYFQSGEEMNKTNWEQFRSYKQDEGRDHRLGQINQHINPYQLEEIIQEKITANRLLREKTRVMEIGAGNGLALMELKKKFPDVEFYAINRKKTHSIYRRESLGGAALLSKIFTHKELEEVELPYLVFMDLDYAQPIPYKAEKFDLIYSYQLLPLMKYKFELISETLRILKDGGVSLHVGTGEIHFYHHGLKIEERKAYYQLKKRGFDIHHNDHFLLFKKTSQLTHIPLRPHFPVPTRPEEVDLKKIEMGYHLPE